MVVFQLQNPNLDNPDSFKPITSQSPCTKNGSTKSKKKKMKRVIFFLFQTIHTGVSQRAQIRIQAFPQPIFMSKISF